MGDASRITGSEWIGRNKAIYGDHGVTSVDVILKRFEAPDETRMLEKGRFEVVRLGRMTIGRATYEPGWKWSEHVGPSVGAARCSVEHVGMVLSGAATAAFDDGTVIEMRAGDLFVFYDNRRAAEVRAPA